MSFMDELFASTKLKSSNQKITLPKVKKEKQVLKEIKRTEVSESPKLTEHTAAMGCFLKAYLLHYHESLTVEQVQALKSLELFKQVEFVSSKFETDEEKLTHDLIMENSYYILDNTDTIDQAILEYQRAYMAGFSKEKRKKTGAVYTPPEIIKWIHDKLEEYSPIDLNKTYWDPASGTGRFPIDWYDRMMKHWRDNQDKYPQLDTVEKAHRHIIEKCLYFSDIDPFAIRLNKLALYLKCPQVTGLKFNNTCEDTLLMEWPKNWPEKFDYVAGNPPYAGNKTANLNSEKVLLYKKSLGFESSEYNLYWSFIDLGVKKATLVGFITPITWLSQVTTMPLRRFVIKSHSIVSIKTHLQSKKIFGSNTTQASSTFILMNGVVSASSIDRVSHLETIIKLYSNLYDAFILPVSLQGKDIFDKIYNNSTTLEKNNLICKKGSTNLESGRLQKIIGDERTPLFGGRENDRYRLRPARMFIDSSKKIPGKFLLFNDKTSSEAHKLDDRWLRGTLVEDCAAGDTTICIFSSNEALLKAICALLNSKLYNWYYSYVSDGNTIGVARFKTLPYPKRESFENFLHPLVDKMLLNPEDKETEAEINKIVYELYGLTEDEIKIIETELGIK